MANFMEVVVREHIEGSPGVVEEQEFPLQINPEHIAIFQRTEETDLTMVVFDCGISLMVVDTYDGFVGRLEGLGNSVTSMIIGDKPTKKPAKKQPTKIKKGKR